MKCALAHILPDGRRVNPKSLAQVYQNHNVSNANGSQVNGQGSGSGTRRHTQAVSTGRNRNVNGYANSQGANPSSGLTPPTASNAAYSSMIKTSPLPTFGSHSTTGSFSSDKNVAASGFPQQELSYSLRALSTASENTLVTNPSFGTGSIWSHSITTQVATNGSLPVNPPYRSMSYSGPGTGGYVNQYGTSTSFHSFLAQHESAIADDEEYDDRNSSDGGDMFEEDFVPSSLSDLLTPQERQRRGSRNSGSAANRPVLTLRSSEDEVTQFKMDEDHEFFIGRDLNLHA